MVNINYKTRHLSLQEKKDLCIRAKEKAFHWHVDKLDCKESLRRQAIDMTFEDALAMMTERDHFVVIWRVRQDESYLEIGFSTIGKDPDYFLWINLKEELILEFTQDLPRI